MEAAYSDDPDPKGEAYAAGVAAGAIAPIASATTPSAASATAPTVVEVIELDEDDEVFEVDEEALKVVEGGEEVQLVVARSLDSFRVERARQDELGKQEAADLERATKESIIFARRKRYRNGASSSFREEGTGNSR